MSMIIQVEIDNHRRTVLITLTKWRYVCVIKGHDGVPDLASLQHPVEDAFALHLPQFSSYSSACGQSILSNARARSRLSVRLKICAGSQMCRSFIFRVVSLRLD